MKKSKEYVIGAVLLLAAIVSLCASGVMGLVLDVGSSIDKVFMFLGFALMGLGVVFMNKSRGKGE